MAFDLDEEGDHARVSRAVERNPAKSPGVASYTFAGESSTFPEGEHAIWIKQCPSIFVSMPLSIPSTRAAAACPSSRRCVAAGGATLVQLRDKTQRHARHGRHRARGEGGARAVRRAAPDQRPGRRGARGRSRRRACRPDRHGGRGCAAPARAATRSSGCRSTPRRWPRRRRSSCSTMSASAASMRPRRRTRRSRRSASTGSPASSTCSAGAIRNSRSCAIAGINAANAGATIAAGADGVSVISALSLAPDPTAAAQDACARWSMTRSRRGKAGNDRRSRSPSRARIPAAAPASRPISRPSPRSASMARASSPR